MGRTLSFYVTCGLLYPAQRKNKGLYVHEYIVTSTAVVSRMFVFKSASYIHRTHARKSGTLGLGHYYIVCSCRRALALPRGRG